MITLERIGVQDLTVDDIQQIVKSCLRGFDGVTALEMIRAAREGHVGIHRITGSAKGIVIFERTMFDQKPGIKILGIAGKGLIGHMEELNEQVRIAAKACGAEFIWGIVSSTGLGRVYQRRANARKVAEIYIEDLP